MNLENKKSVLVVMLLVIIFGGAYVFSTKNVNAPIDEQDLINNEKAEINGKFICLPHKNPGDFVTMECAFGVKNSRGENYALDLNKMPENFVSEILMDKNVTVTGIVVPIEKLSTDFWMKYDVVGIIQVFDVRYEK